MNKSTQNNRRYNTITTKKIAEKYNCTVRYVRGSISSNYKGLKPDILKKAYNDMLIAINDTIEKLQKEKI